MGIENQRFQLPWSSAGGDFAGLRVAVAVVLDMFTITDVEEDVEDRKIQ